MEYELINPSDPYTFLADDAETAALVVLLISNLCGAESKDKKEYIPILLSPEQYIERFGRTAKEGLNAKRNELAIALESMMYGHFKDRKRYEAALKAITDQEKKKLFMDEWQDAHTSLNDIGTYCHELATKIKEMNTEERE